jgi:hypothetical protein
LLPPQGAANVVLVGVHTPIVVGSLALAPTQVEKDWQGTSDVHVLSATRRRSRQSNDPSDSVLHIWPGAHTEVTHEAPSRGSSAHTPQEAFLVPEQKRLAHCPAIAQVWPLASLPGGAQSAGGLAPLSK